jgi:D-threonate/D-erythronate kinase
MAMRFGIVADDLTGAGDSAVQFGSRGWTAAVSFELTAEQPDFDAVAVDTESRYLTADTAAERVTAAMRAVACAPLVLKKLDSTLRGQLVAELSAALVASGRRTVVLAPAFPTYGRTTREAPTASDPLAPVTESHLPTLFRDITDRWVVVVPRRLRANARAWSEIGDARFIVADAETEADLDALVQIVPTDASVLWCGSTGLARALGRAYVAHTSGGRSSQTPARRVLVVVGSVNSVSRAQLSELLRQPEVASVVVDPHDPDTASAADMSASCWVLHSAAGAPEPGKVDPELARLVSASLALAAERLATELGADAIVATGGETAIAVVRRFGGQGIVVDGEVEAGIPSGRMIGGGGLRIVTKAGGFGGPDALSHAVQDLLADRELAA